MANIFTLPIVTSRAGGIGLSEGGTNQSDGVITTATYRHRRTIVATAGTVTALRLLFANMLGEGQINNNITVQASVVVGGVVFPLTFNLGASSVLILPNGLVESDPVFIPALNAGDTFETLVNVTVALGERWAIGNPVVVTTGDGKIDGTNAVLSNAGLSSADAYAYAPVAVLGVSSRPMPGVNLVGDSIISGNGDINHENGFGVRACNTAGVGWVRISIPGETAATFITNNARRARLISQPTTICNYGVNDVNGGAGTATVKTSLIAAWTICKNAGSTVYQTTITPAELTGSKETVRTAINTWLRSGQAKTENPTLLTGVFDAAAQVESATDGGAVLLGGAFWAAGMKSNSLHPSAAGHTAMATAVTPATLTSRKFVVASSSGTGGANRQLGIGIG